MPRFDPETAFFMATSESHVTRSDQDYADIEDALLTRVEELQNEIDRLDATASEKEPADS